ncbi:cytochrome P450 4F3 omega-hydroxylase [Clathrospora elynae]|uniref:Cytochrome P450 4F3 omega-hydroxylase n=1 Tax=Clathrospora elynae TaxID=706981 RepID=A0A6A5T287_9PLEO|nr:cytochrome P450 4F3 omega-hydroxylase [Clathrospora elynae]
MVTDGNVTGRAYSFKLTDADTDTSYGCDEYRGCIQRAIQAHDDHGCHDCCRAFTASRNYRGCTPVWLVLFFLLRAIYRLTFDPLRAFPGPASRAISHIPHARSILSGYLPHDLTSLHARYGGVVRIAPDMLSFTAAAAWTDISAHGASRRFQKWGMTRSHKGVDHILSADHSWSGTVVNVKEWLKRTAFDIVGDLAFGEPFGCLSDGAYHPWVALLFLFIKALFLFGVARQFKPFTPLLIALMPKKSIKQRAQHIKVSAEKVHKRLAAGEQPHRSDFWMYIPRHNDEKGMSVQEMESNANIFITGGSESVATALCGIMYLLAKNPDAMRALYEEITGAYVTHEDINMISVGQLKVLQAIIYEGMRIYPPVPAGLQRSVPKGGAVVAGHLVPEGAIVNVAQQPAYHLPSNFAHPSVFAFKRWLPDAPAEFSHDRKDVFQSFSTGPRNCVGKNLALAEMKLVRSYRVAF